MRAKIVYTNGKPYTLVGTHVGVEGTKDQFHFIVNKPAKVVGGGVKVIHKEIVTINKSDIMGYQIKNSRAGSTTTVCVSRSRLKELNEILSHA